MGNKKQKKNKKRPYVVQGGAVEERERETGAERPRGEIESVCVRERSRVRLSTRPGRVGRFESFIP